MASSFSSGRCHKMMSRAHHLDALRGSFTIYADMTAMGTYLTRWHPICTYERYRRSFRDGVMRDAMTRSVTPADLIVESIAAQRHQTLVARGSFRSGICMACIRRIVPYCAPSFCPRPCLGP